jgi:hypothetical protein
VTRARRQCRAPLTDRRETPPGPARDRCASRGCDADSSRRRVWRCQALRPGIAQRWPPRRGGTSTAVTATIIMPRSRHTRRRGTGAMVTKCDEPLRSRNSGDRARRKSVANRTSLLMTRIRPPCWMMYWTSAFDRFWTKSMGSVRPVTHGASVRRAPSRLSKGVPPARVRLRR